MRDENRASGPMRGEGRKGRARHSFRVLGPSSRNALFPPQRARHSLRLKDPCDVEGETCLKCLYTFLCDGWAR